MPEPERESRKGEPPSPEELARFIPELRENQKEFLAAERDLIEKELDAAIHRVIEIIRGPQTPAQTSDPGKTTEADTAKEDKNVAQMPEMDEDWKPFLSFRTWRWMKGSFAGLCLIILAINIFLGPSKVPITLVCIGLAGMLVMTALAIYEFFHWVNT